MRTFSEGTILSLWGNRDWPVKVQTFREGQSLVWLSIASRVTTLILNTVNPFIDLDNISYAYPGRQEEVIPALNGVTLRIDEGEYVALAGANGSGKSTLARMLNALLVPDRGTVTIAMHDTRNPAHHLAIRRTVGMVFQRPEDQMIASTIEDDVAFGPENLAVPPIEIRARVRQALEIVDMWSMRERRPDKVSAGQMQRVALAGILAMHPRCIVFDEATAMLDPAGRKTVRAFMQRLHAEGLTVINITHHMEETLDATRLVVLDHGHIAMDGKPDEVFLSGVALHALGLDLPPAGALAEILREQGLTLPEGLFTVRDLVAALHAMPPPRLSSSFMPGQRQPVKDPFLTVRDLDYIYMPGTPAAHQALDKVDMTIHEHVAHGLIGPTGAGKSTLLQHLNGLMLPQHGSVIVDGLDLGDPATDLNRVRRLVGLVFQLPESQIFEQYVGDEIAYGPRLAGMDGEALRQRVRWAMALVGLDFDSTKDRPTFALSGGEKRKVALASSLALHPAVLLLDEPTAGLDPVSRRDLLQRLSGLAGEMTLVLSSHQMEDLVYLVEELSVLSDGRMVMTGSPESIFSKGSILREIGLDVPIATEVAQALRALGWSLPEGIVRMEQLAGFLRDAYG